MQTIDPMYMNHSDPEQIRAAHEDTSVWDFEELENLQEQRGVLLEQIDLTAENNDALQAENERLRAFVGAVREALQTGWLDDVDRGVKAALDELDTAERTCMNCGAIGATYHPVSNRQDSPIAPLCDKCTAKIATD